MTDTDDVVDLDAPTEPDAPQDTPDAVEDSGADEAQAVEAEDTTKDEDTTEESPNAEAAKWRHRFRDEQSTHKQTRAALESMTGRVEALQRQQIEALLDAAKVKPAALWATTELAALVAEDGTVDTGKVRAAIDTARKTLGIAPVGKGSHVPGVGNRPEVSARKPADFADAFRPKRK